MTYSYHKHWFSTSNPTSNVKVMQIQDIIKWMTKWLFFMMVVSASILKPSKHKFKLFVYIRLLSAVECKFCLHTVCTWYIVFYMLICMRLFYDLNRRFVLRKMSLLVEHVSMLDAFLQSLCLTTHTIITWQSTMTWQVVE